MFQLKKITKHYSGQRQATLIDIDLDIKPRKITALIGQSGAGKSTLLRLLNGLEKASSGEITFEQSSLNHMNKKGLNQLRQKIGMVFQHYHLLNNKTVWENIALPLQLLKTPAPEIKQHVSNLLSLVELVEFKDCYPNQLSGGQKQRVAIARALAAKPKLLLLDEATSALDPETTEKILSLILSIQEKLKLTIVFVSHEIDFVKKLADEIVLLDRGQIIENSEKFNFFLNPKTDLAKEYVFANLHKNIQINEKAGSDDHALLIRLTFKASTTHAPLMAKLTQEKGVLFSIITSQIEKISHQQIGHLIIAIKQTEKNICFDYFNAHDIRYEVLGYAHHHY